MRTLLVLACCLALAGVVRAEGDQEGKGKKKQTTKPVVRSSANWTNTGGKYRTARPRPVDTNATNQQQLKTKQSKSSFRGFHGEVMVGTGETNGAVQTNGKLKKKQQEEPKHAVRQPASVTQKSAGSRSAAAGGGKPTTVGKATGKPNAAQNNNMDIFIIQPKVQNARPAKAGKPVGAHKSTSAQPKRSRSPEPH